MKAVVVDIKGNKAVGLTPNGTFVKIKNTGKLGIGCEVDVPTGIIKFNGFAKTVSIAAALIFVIGLGLFAYNTPYSYIDIDINPSIEVTVNIFNRIIDIKALNNDGNKIIDNISVKNREVKTGIENIIKSALAEGYLKDNNTSAVMFTVSSKSENKVSNIEKTVQSTTSKELKAVKANPEVVVEKVTVENHDKAIKQGISPGKLLLIQKVRQLKPELKIEDLKEKPVKEILKLIQDNKKDNKKGKNTDKASPTPAKIKDRTQNSANPTARPTNKLDKAKDKDKDTYKGNDNDNDKDKDKDKNKDRDKNKDKNINYGKNNNNNNKNIGSAKNNYNYNKNNDIKKSNINSFTPKNSSTRNNFPGWKSTETINKNFKLPSKKTHWKKDIPQNKSNEKKNN